MVVAIKATTKAACGWLVLPGVGVVGSTWLTLPVQELAYGSGEPQEPFLRLLNQGVLKVAKNDAVNMAEECVYRNLRRGGGFRRLFRTSQLGGRLYSEVRSALKASQASTHGSYCR